MCGFDLSNLAFAIFVPPSKLQNKKHRAANPSSLLANFSSSCWSEKYRPLSGGTPELKSIAMSRALSTPKHSKTLSVVFTGLLRGKP
jgi:hypothetical protein